MPYITQTDRVLAIIADPQNAPMSLAQIVTEEIDQFVHSARYEIMVEAEAAYRNRTRIQEKQNPYAERSNTKIEHPLLKKLVDQKVNYAMSRPFSISTESEAYSKQLTEVFNSAVRRKLSAMLRGAPKLGVGWIIPYIGEDGKLGWMVESALRIVPLWKDLDESDIGGFIRFYPQVVYVGSTKRDIMRAELWSTEGVFHFVNDGGQAYRADDEMPKTAHVTVDGSEYNWAQVPIAWVKYNEDQLPLHYYIRDLIESINWQTSVTDDVLRDVARFVWVLKNYGGADLAEFVRELYNHLAVKVESDGGVDKIQPDLDVTAVMAFLEKQRRDAFDYGSGVDTKDPDLGNASGTAINFRYMDLDNDCAGLAQEMQTAIERMKTFIDAYLQLIGAGSFAGQTFEIKLNMDMPANETDIITNCSVSAGLISQRTMLANHPWVEDVDEEIKWLDEEREKAVEEAAQYDFPRQADGDGGDGDVDG